MKKIVFYLAAFISLMSGCGQKTDNTKELAFAQQRDSLESIIQQKDNEINPLHSSVIRWRVLSSRRIMKSMTLWVR